MVESAFLGSQNQPKSSLGTDRKIRVQVPTVPAPPDGETPSEYRFRLQKWARSCYGNYDHRLSGCCIRPLPGGYSVDVRRNPDTGSAQFVGLEQCNRVWTCPVCAQRITNQRRKELSEALAAAKLRGWTPVLVTYTVQHEGSDLLEHLLARQEAALRDFKSGRAWQEFKSEFGLMGGIKALEVTYGQSGWHPHIHELMFFDLPREMINPNKIKSWLAPRWITKLQLQGLNASFEHGLDVRTADSEIADYIAKWGHEPRELAWGAEHELAKAPNKKAHQDGLTPFQLLEAVSGGDRKARVLFVEYARALDGKRQLRWSPGLRKLLQLPDELTDEQLPLIDESPAAYVAASFTPENWKRICLYELQPLVLELIGQGDLRTLNAVLKIREIYGYLYDPPDDRPPDVEEKLLPTVNGSKPIYSQLMFEGLPAERKVRSWLK